MPETYIYLIIHTEGEYSSREWDVVGVYSEMNMALDKACRLAAQEFRNGKMTFNNFWPEYHIEAWALNGSLLEDTNMTRSVNQWDVKQRHPELRDIIEAREREESARQALLEKASIEATRIRAREKLDDGLRSHDLTIAQYIDRVQAL